MAMTDPAPALTARLEEAAALADDGDLVGGFRGTAELLREAATALAQLQQLDRLGWFAFCDQHREKVNDLCPRCELIATKAEVTRLRAALEEIVKYFDPTEAPAERYVCDLAKTALQSPPTEEPR